MVTSLAERLEAASAPGEQLAALAESVAAVVGRRYVRVEIDRADGIRAHVELGAPSADTVELPVRYRDEDVGRLVLPAADVAALTPDARRLLGDLLRQAAAAARAGSLGASLQRARVALVTAREEERRRLRRDLHDSLGPGLGAVTLRIETARELAATDPHAADVALERATADPHAADVALERATADIAALLADVRRLVHDLRPPALDELGLEGAVREQAHRLGSEGLDVVVTTGDDDTGDDGLGALPAAVEVAAFRIVSEALTNVVRHARATRATVRLRRGPDTLDVEIRDDGVGLGPDVVPGVGTQSIRERAAELGGRVTLGAAPGGGTVVAAHLPLENPA